MTKKWKFTPPADALRLPETRYYLVDPLDDKGPRACLSLAIHWDGEQYCYLLDAAGHWGPAPYSLFPARAAFKISALGSWQEFSLLHEKSLGAVAKVSVDENGMCSDSGLMLMRSALRLEVIASASHRFESSEAKRALDFERKRDEEIRRDKRSQFISLYPDWAHEEAKLLGTSGSSALLAKELKEQSL